RGDDPYVRPRPAGPRDSRADRLRSAHDRPAEPLPRRQPQGDAHHRSHRHGGRNCAAAGYLPVQAGWLRCQRQGERPLRRHRKHPGPVPGAVVAWNPRGPVDLQGAGAQLMDDFRIVMGVVLVAAIVIGVTLLQLAQDFLARQKNTITAQAEGGLQDMFIFIDPTTLFYYNVGALVLIPVILWILTDSLVVPVGAAIAITIAPRFVVSHLKKKRLKDFEKQLPDALLMVSGGMRAGASLTVAMESMIKEQRPPLSQEFELMLREQRLGVDFDTAMKHMEQRM